MTRILNGLDLAGFIEERQARQVRALRQASHIFPKLVIIKSTVASPVIDTYIRMKQRYGDEILIETAVETLKETDMLAAIDRLNADETVHGIIVQLPLAKGAKIDDILNRVDPKKDVDGLGKGAKHDSATAVAINWLLAGYGVDLRGKKIAIVGHGRLVGAPLARMWRNSDLDITVFDEDSQDEMKSTLHEFDAIVTATGTSGLIKSDMVKIGAVVVDAGTASEQGKIVGDVSDDVRARDDLTITPEKGGVGPLTIVALFDNVIRAAS